MGRRCRHLNPVHMGAGYALDARFLSGYANGANVTSWASRPGRSFTFGTGTAAPIFTHRVAAAANQPGVSFTAASSHSLLSTNTKVIPTNSTSFTLIDFSSGGTDFITFAQRAANRTAIGCVFGTGNAAQFDIAVRRGVFNWYYSSGVLQGLTVAPFENGLVFSARQDVSVQSVRSRWNTLNSRASTGGYRQTAATSLTGFRTGVHHASCAFASALSLSNWRRIVEHYAYSFKSAL